ncbi:cytochrome P450 6k1-like [Ctenocephalides felis]|uniref:cytochrome P450 6k1-like n=1 Tax=Ctenocephalides felis TaxID=7515 RepID=UPI000E6E21A2|nr:cytochrome P450 6k1-like [Ctenocephalides felis]
MDLINIFLLLVTFVGTFIYYYHNYSTYWSSKGIASFKPLPFVGNFKDVLLAKVNSGIFMKSLYERTKAPALGMYVFNKPSLLVRDPEWIKTILVKDFNFFYDRIVAVAGDGDTLGTKNLFSIKNPDWKQMRVKLTPIFTSGKMKSMFHLMNDEGRNLNEYLHKLADSKKPSDNARELSARYTTDVIATCAYGIKANCMNNPEAEFRSIGRKIFEVSFRRVFELSSFFFFPRIVSLLGLKFFAHEGTEFIRNTFNETIRIREESKTKRHDLVDVLIDLKNAKTAPGEIKFDGDTLVAQAAVFFTAGFETSSSTMSYTLYELAINPDVQKKLRAEIKEIIAKDDITYESINKMSYLDMVISETLRKYPPLAFLDRKVVDNSNGYRLPKPHDDVVLDPGTPIYIPMLGLHMDPEYFPDPEKFNPERFTDEAKRNRIPYTYFPFGTGPRNCIGERFGLLQTKLGLVHMLKDFTVHPCADTPSKITFTPLSFLLTPKDTINLKFLRA